MAQTGDNQILFVFAGKGLRVNYNRSITGVSELSTALTGVMRRVKQDLRTQDAALLDGDGIEVTLENIAVHGISPVFLRSQEPREDDISPTRETLNLPFVEDVYVNERGKVLLENPSARPQFRAPKPVAPNDRPRSQLEFVQMMSANKDPLCRGNAPFPEISLAELASHKSPDDAWIALSGKVYDMTKYVNCHPGGRVIMQAAGKDGTEMFRKFHPWVNADALIGKLQVGTLENRSRAQLLAP